MKPILLTITTLLLLFTKSSAQQFHFNTLTSEEGLSHNSVFSIAQDYKGFMWFGTRDGVSRYDSQRIKNYYVNAYSPNVEANRVNCVYAVGKNLWVGTEIGLFRYVFEKDSFEQVRLNQGATYVWNIKQVSNGELWISTQDGLYILGQQGQIRHILPKQNIRSVCEFRKGTYLILQDSNPRIINSHGETVVTPTLTVVSQEKLASFRNYIFYKDRQGAVWLGTNGGLLQLDEKTMVFRPVDWLNRLVKTNIRVVRTITEDGAGNMWIGSEAGAVVIDKQRRTAQWYDKLFAASPYSLTDRAVYSSYVSRDGTVWLGTYFGGINYARPVGISFNHLFPDPNGKGLSGKAISQLVEDEKQRLWIATEDNGITVLDQTTGNYTYHNRSNGLSDNNIHTVYVDKSGVAWIGTFLGGLNRIDPVTGHKRIYTHNPADSTSLSNNFVCTVYRDRGKRLWVGTIHGLNIMDEQTGRFRLVRPDVLGRTFIYSLLEDHTGQIWIATRYAGIYRYDPSSDRLSHYHVGNTRSLRNNQIISMYEDSNHNMWFGSINGGGHWNNRLKKFIPNPVDRHLPSQTIYGILEDSNGLIWFSTNRGLLSFDPGAKTYRIFDKSNGLQATQFNYSSYLKNRSGILYFGSVDGLCYFDPALITKRASDPPVYFTDLKLFNKSVKVGDEQMLTRHLDGLDELIFHYDQNVITLDFVAINYFSKRTNYYQYYLEGFEKNWGPKTTKNSQTYTNLSPGTYTFHVRSFLSNGELSPSERTIQLRIKPPFWQTTYAYLLYLLLGVGALLAYRRFITFLNNQKMAVQMARVEREKSTELNQQKLNFFTFLSNEFKTPITLIMAEIDELIQSNQAWRSDSATNYSVIKNNAKRLKAIIDQITELRKAEHESPKVNLTDLDVVAFVKETVQGFNSLLQSRHIRKRITFSPSYLMASFDAGKLEMIIGNVIFFLTNEFAEGDELAIDVHVVNHSNQLDSQLSIDFSLDGQQELFNSIKTSYQLAVENEELFQQNSSANIGILLTFSLLKLLLGSVAFSEEADKYTLRVRLPIRKSPVSKTAVGLKQPNLLRSQIVGVLDDLPFEREFADETLSTDKPTILVVDRSKDLAQFLKRHYQESYRIIISYTFSEGLKRAETVLPELILCDSDIRDKEQRNLCVALKKNPLTQAIPVILLLNDEDEKTIIDGLNKGANGYIGKPFNLRELDLLIGNQLTSVALLKTKLAGSLTDSHLTTLPRRNKEQEFILRFASLVKQEYKNKDVTADTLSQLMNCSRSQLHTKLKSLTGLSTKEYLNEYRLTIARQLLEGGMSVSEVAFEVGFGDPNYFGRAFKKKYGLTPSKSN
ncbi:two-component regulator propeller domain-containing protein [Spirosoma validum]|uniref:Helix-turn-helix domain-containing protein n=1 Tax=Spirosoma validum TaxID=2771355 RepID=A0A927B4H7_9BACT|nr:two-component regulator propeller domain-containing protein [Spirosoma validum]MBD2755148.1 helix-turn-helix domain-containing protein [Spirosoma validum]